MLAYLTDMPRPRDLSVNKSDKHFLKRCFEDWYTKKLSEQLSDVSDVQSTDLQLISLGLLVLKELGAKWMVEMFEYFAANPQIIVNGFVKAGITGALDREYASEDQEEEDNMESETESDFEVM